MISKVSMFAGKSVADQHSSASSHHHARNSQDLCNDVTMGKVHVSFPSNVAQQQLLQEKTWKKIAPKLHDSGLIRIQNCQEEFVNNARLPVSSKSRQQGQQLLWDEFNLHERLVKEQLLTRGSGKKQPRDGILTRMDKIIEDQPLKKLRLEHTPPDIVYIDSKADCKKTFPLPMLCNTKIQKDGHPMGIGCLQSFQTKWERLEWFSDRVDDTVADQTAFVTEFFLRSMTANPTGHLKKKLEKIGRNTTTNLQF